MLRVLALLFALLAAAPADAAQPLDWARLPLPSLDGGTLAPDTLKGKVVLVVNTASFCSFTPQYKALEALWARYRDKGFVVLGVPSNDFGDQEPGTNGEIKTFCDATFGIDFPMLAKQSVHGPEAHPFFAWTKSQRAGEPRWNFYKYLVGRDGTLLGSYSSLIEPDATRITGAIEQALATP
jgi:glutathione peroxidase